MEKLWIVRSNGGEYLETFFKHRIVAIGWCSEINFENKDINFIKKVLIETYPECRKSIPAWAGFINNFVNKMSINDYVLTYDPSSRIYYIGRIAGNYEYNNKVEFGLYNTRKVKWNQQGISRDLVSNSTKNSLGSPQTLFQLNEVQGKEILRLMSNSSDMPKEEDLKEENNENARNLIENVKENLKDIIQSLDPESMEELFKEILNAMGYVARRTKKGADRGVDIFASKDGLGLEEPRIFAEVKHRKGQMGSQEIRTFMGGRQQSDKCLYVSTGGYTKEARYEAERSSIPLTLVDIDDLADLISLHYDKFSAEGKALLPLKKVYIPIG